MIGYARRCGNDRCIASCGAIVLLVIVLAIVRQVTDGARHTFGHPGLFDGAVLALIWGLVITHAVIAGIMFIQRRDWLPSDAAMFRFIAVKMVFWAMLGIDYTSAGRGLRLSYVILYLALAVTTIDLDVRLVRRFLLRTEDERYDVWNGRTERREPGVPGRRATDQVPS